MRRDRYGLILAMVMLAMGWARAGDLKKRVWNFEADEPGRIARGFTAAVGRWEVERDGDNHVMAQKASNSSKSFNVALLSGEEFRDLDIGVRLKAVSGEIDRGGGVVWRARDPENYYIARYNPLEDNLRVYKVENGHRTQLDHADVPGDGRWHTLRITMTGREILGYFDGKKLLVAEDSTYLEAGRIGLWSKADARTSFDDLTVSGE